MPSRKAEAGRCGGTRLIRGRLGLRLDRDWLFQCGCGVVSASRWAAFCLAFRSAQARRDRVSVHFRHPSLCFAKVTAVRRLEQ